MKLSEQGALLWVAQRAAATADGQEAAREAALSIAVHSDHDAILDRAALFLRSRFGIGVYPFAPDADPHEGTVRFTKAGAVVEARVKPLHEAAAALGLVA